MSKTHDNNAEAVIGIARRTGPPFLLFSSMLTAALVFSQTMVLPVLARVEAGGQRRDVAELHDYEQSLHARISSLEYKRDTLILPIQDESYRRLMSRKQARLSLDVVDAAIREIAESFVTEGGNVVAVMETDVSYRDRTITIRGDVRNVGTRSMTVLAQFTEKLKGLHFARSVENPRYVRLRDESVGMHSPFVIVIHLP